MSVTENDLLGRLEFVRSGDDDLIAGGEPVENFDLGDAGGGEPQRAPFRDISMDDIGNPAAFLIDEGASVHHQYVLAPVDEYSHRESLALPQAGRLFVAETQARGDLTGHHLRRYAAHGSGPMPASALQIGAHPGTQVARETLGDFDLDFE